MLNEHYRRLIQDKKKTKLASCGYVDRFDPFKLNKNPRVRQLYENIFGSHLKDISCQRLLDVGCGTGIYFDVLARYSEFIEAIDLSGEMIQVAQEYCQQNGLTNIRSGVGSVESLEFDDESFDVVIELDVIHHVQDLGTTLAEIYRVLKPGGHFLVFEPNICNPLMFFAHALPIEERLALGRNRPTKLISLLEERFTTINWTGICELITHTHGVKRLLLDAYLKLWSLIGLESCYPRQVWLGIKPASQ
jgi:2-polyprenyl-3-methyl-5-hydroxy-6-metoxy-1,4-benzoquinol methylase